MGTEIIEGLHIKSLPSLIKVVRVKFIVYNFAFCLKARLWARARVKARANT